MATVLFLLFQVLIEYLSQSPAKSNNRSPGERIRPGPVDPSPLSLSDASLYYAQDAFLKMVGLGLLLFPDVATVVEWKWVR